MKDYIKTKNDTDYTEIMISVYNLLSEKYKYSARITDIYNLLKDSFGLLEFDLLDFEKINGIELESWIIDRFVDWKRGNPVNFTEIYRYLLESSDFSDMEKDLFENGFVEERLWAIFKLVDTPELTFN